MTVEYGEITSPVGPLFIAAEGDRICAVIFENGWPHYSTKLPGIARKETAAIKRAADQLHEYFAGNRQAFDLPLNFSFFGTEFQQSVWRALAEIPFGETRTYSQQAQMVGRPKAVRAVGAANGQNPFCIILPCHRVIGANGSLTGFGGGLDTKRILLEHEARVLVMPQRSCFKDAPEQENDHGTLPLRQPELRRVLQTVS